MLIPKKNRREVYKYLFKGELWSCAPGFASCECLDAGSYNKAHCSCAFCSAEGVLQAEKDFNLEKHPEVDVPNLHVIKLMQSFKSKEFVTERFAWRHYYW